MVFRLSLQLTKNVGAPYFLVGVTNLRSFNYFGVHQLVYSDRRSFFAHADLFRYCFFTACKSSKLINRGDNSHHALGAQLRLYMALILIYQGYYNSCIATRHHKILIG